MARAKAFCCALWQVGDGDCGSTLAQGAVAIQQQLASLPLDDPSAAALALGRLVGRAMGGTSGAVVRGSLADVCLAAGTTHGSRCLDMETRVRTPCWCFAAVQNPPDGNRRQPAAAPCGATHSGSCGHCRAGRRAGCQQVWRRAAGQPHDAGCDHPCCSGATRGLLDLLLLP